MKDVLDIDGFETLSGNIGKGDRNFSSPVCSCDCAPCGSPQCSCPPVDCASCRRDGSMSTDSIWDSVPQE